MHRVSGLNVLCAAIALWNTVYVERAVEELRGGAEASRSPTSTSPLSGRDGRDGRQLQACRGTPHVREGQLRPPANSQVLQEAVAEPEYSALQRSSGTEQERVGAPRQGCPGLPISRIPPTMPCYSMRRRLHE